jgi:dihydroxyacetone kinase-like protein
MVRGTQMSDLTDAQVVAWIGRFARTVMSDEAELGELDRLAGDGDFGANVASAARKTVTGMAESPALRAESAFATLSRAFMSTGGTSGPLFGMWFREFSKALGDSSDTHALAAGAVNGLQAVQRLGHAEVGHKTMVDAMSPAAAILASCAEEGVGVQDAMLLAAQEARRGAQSTLEMRAERGRATYVGDRAVGVLDPGAVTVALFFESGVHLEATT